MAIKKSDEQISGNFFKNDAHVYVTRKALASQIVVLYKNKHEIHWTKYQIKESDRRQKTATFTSPNYFDLTTGVYCVLITSKMHEDFGGILISVKYNEDTGLYEYQCQDHSRAYQSKFESMYKNSKGNDLHRILCNLITRGNVGNGHKPTKNELKLWSDVLSGLRPASHYWQGAWGGVDKVNPMTNSYQLVMRNSSYIEAIRNLVFATGAYIDVYIDKYGVVQIEPLHKDDWENTGLYLTTPEMSSVEHTFDTTNIITGTLVHNADKSKLGVIYTSPDLLNIDLKAVFGNLRASIDNPNQSTTTSNTNAKTNNAKNKTSKKQSVTNKKNNNIYGTKKKVVWLNIDWITGQSSDYGKMNTIKSVLQKNGWEVHIAGWGSESHYQRRAECKNGIWFCLYGGACGGTLREHGADDWFLNPLKRNKSRVVVGFFPPTSSIKHGGKYYKHLPPAHDWQGSQSYAHIDYPAKFLSKHGVPFMYANTPKEMASKFLAGGDNYTTEGNGYKWHDSWTKHNPSWIK